MKTITMILLSLFLAKGCSQETKNDIAEATIHYEALTRGFNQSITIKDKMVASGFVNRGDVKEGAQTAISDADWKELIASFEGINLDSLATFKDPTQKRFYDGAASAKITITYKGKTYESTDFDHGFPPVEIEKLVNKVVSFGKQ